MTTNVYDNALSTLAELISERERLELTIARMSAELHSARNDLMLARDELARLQEELSSSHTIRKHPCFEIDTREFELESFSEPHSSFVFESIPPDYEIRERLKEKIKAKLSNHLCSLIDDAAGDK
jgi:hypothetical protein